MFIIYNENDSWLEITKDEEAFNKLLKESMNTLGDDFEANNWRVFKGEFTEFSLEEAYKLKKIK